MADKKAQRNAVRRIGAIRQSGAYDPEFVVRDLLTDLMHWCAAEGIEYDEEVAVAGQHFIAEGN